jgi:hypothetical protein
VLAGAGARAAHRPAELIKSCARAHNETAHRVSSAMDGSVGRGDHPERPWRDVPPNALTSSRVRCTEALAELDSMVTALVLSSR